MVVFAQPKLVLTVKSRPGELYDVAFAVCERGNLVYVVGYERFSEDDRGFRVEARWKGNGSLVKHWSFNPTGGRELLHDCLIVGDKLIAVGGMRNETRMKWLYLCLT